MASRKKSGKRIWLVTGLAFAGLVVLVFIGRAAGWIGGEPVGHSVEVSKVSERNIVRIVTATGRIQPETEVKIAPDVSGEIIELNVREGDFVHEGDVLLRIRPDIIQARKDEMQATILGQKARMEQNRASKLRAQNEFEQKKTLFDKGMVSQLEYENARRTHEAEVASFNASVYQVDNARAQLRRIEEELRQTTIKAPMTGTISRLDVERGERVVGSIQMAGTEMLRIARMEQMEVQVNVNENDIVYVAEDDTARIEVDAYPGREFIGVVTEIANSAITRGDGTAEQITEYPVKIRILSPHNPDTRESGAPWDRSDMVRLQDSEVAIRQPVAYFKPGMTATVDVETVREENVVSVPLQAVTMRDFSAGNPDTTEIDEEDMRRVVFRVDDDKANMVEVITGISDDRFIHVLSGLQPGDRVVSGNYRVLSRELQDGNQIRIASR
ncbi:efflux RND transporter periplasmic adaptor subunit [Natronogracilivirga saccharolytica]|uniref:Efflux RND transporter periplasmic adaptor subunit n=1 Tax=Natronogracilivirga saccharolytica TaxID=2812953 RepID=A0A8J7S370_9BACT|nr:efflux RND transporter periplasmic adaptor subunit [Natronogracilivirga saccharolytica]MBP3191218.1 efflux RND transporter periplasmic adaptor subunit [Natronogracilivirga saccharolytica]